MRTLSTYALRAGTLWVRSRLVNSSIQLLCMSPPLTRDSPTPTCVMSTQVSLKWLEMRHLKQVTSLPMQRSTALTLELEYTHHYTHPHPLCLLSFPLLWTGLRSCSIPFCSILSCFYSIIYLTYCIMTWHDMTWHDMTWHDMTWLNSDTKMEKVAD